MTTLDARNERRVVGPLFAGFLLLYVVSLPVVGDAFVSPLIFGSDDMVDAYQGGGGRNLTIKHPLFVLASLIYRVASVVFSWAPPSLAYNLSMVFPMAILGASGVCVAYFVFLRLADHRREALYFAILYGVSGTAWFFGSFPETYVLTALCSNLFLWSVFNGTSDTPHVRRMALFNALACYASPQQIFLFLIPAAQWIRERRPFQRIRSVIQYAVVMAVVFAIPYEVYLKLFGRGWKFAPVYLRVYGHLSNLLDARWIIVGVSNFFLYSVVPPATTPGAFTDHSLSIVTLLPVTWLGVCGLFVAFCLFCLSGLTTSRSRDVAVPMLTFLVSYTSFFVYFNPPESFIYTLPALLPLLLVLQAGFHNRSRRYGQPLLLLIVLAVFASNLNFRLYLHSFKVSSNSQNTSPVLPR